MGNASAYWVRLGGTTPATEIAPHTRPTWETWADGGNGPASFELGKSAKSLHYLLTPGTLMEVLIGCGRTWIGRVEDFDANEGSVVGRGIHTDLLAVPALDGLGATTRVSATAVTTAKDAPWNLRVNDPNGVLTTLGTASGDDTNPQMVATLLDQCATQLGMRWGQDHNAALYLRSDAGTLASRMLVPGVARFGPTSEGQASHLVARYLAVGGAYATVTRFDSTATKVGAEVFDLSERGEMSEAQVVTILDAALAAGKSQTGWVNGVTVTRDQLTTIGGTRSALAGVRAGERLNVPEFGSGRSAIIGKTRYTAGDEMIYLEPAATAPRTFADVIAAT